MRRRVSPGRKRAARLAGLEDKMAKTSRAERGEAGKDNQQKTVVCMWFDNVKMPFLQELRYHTMTESDSDGFFNSYGMDVQTLMLRDASRLDAYAAAIEANRDFIRGRIVLDVGAGTGALHLTSLEMGAH